jgi:hypothetical protein
MNWTKENIPSYPTKQIVMGVSTIGKYIETRDEHTGSPPTRTCSFSEIGCFANIRCLSSKASGNCS